MRVGVMGGTFDPIHVGHLVAAEEVRWALGLTKVVFVPAAQPPHKQPGEISAVEHRVQMVRLAIASNQGFELSLVETERVGRSYTVDTLEILGARLGPQAELFFLMGMDSLEDLVTWKDPARLITLCRLVVVNRPPYPPVRLDRLEERIAGISGRVELVRMPGIDVSATELRDRVALGHPIRYQVPEPVERYIRETGLYRTP
jgi:nicotinate-nucleotide adenylyltransferase